MGGGREIPLRNNWKIMETVKYPMDSSNSIEKGGLGASVTSTTI